MTELQGVAADAEFVRRLSRRTGEMLLEQFFAENVATHSKPDFSLVTEADLAADRMIREALAASYPEDGLISEELAPHYERAAERTWIVDPLDGTSNFALRLPFWGVSIALADAQGPLVAAVYFPALSEMFTAVRGAGAKLNGHKTEVAAPDPKHGVGFLACCSRTPRRYHVAVPLKPRILGSAAYSLCAVAKGTAALALETTPRIWDVAAAELIVREAGGLVEPFEGAGAFPLREGWDYTERSFSTIAAATPQLLADARHSITPR